MTDLFRPAGQARSGRDPVLITPKDAGWDFCGLHVLSLAPGESRTVTLDGSEAAVLPLKGSCRVEIGGRAFDLGGRPDVFTKVSDFVYAPRDSEVVVSSTSGGEFALPAAAATRRLEPVRVPAEAVSVEVRGGGLATRQINNFMSADAFEADRLIAVEVLTPDGNWSSFPPHKHDEHSETEVPLEEIYYFRIQGEQGFGIHRTYTTDRSIDATETVHDGDVFLIPRGYHGPCIAAPGHTMYYLNVMAGPAERAWRITTDPAHGWLLDYLESLGADPRCPLTSAGGPTSGGRS